MTDFLTTREVANLLRVSMSCVTRRATELGGVRVLGHGSFSMTMDRYGFLFDDDESEIMRRL